jgi:signal peptidase I
MLENTSSTTKAPRRRWVGVLLSLFVPGFGLIRARRIWRGIAWFLAVQVIGVLAVLIAIWRSIPFWGVLAGLVIALGCELAMLVDSFRAGRLNARLWLIFVAALLAITLLPSAPHLFARAFRIPTDGMAPTLRGRSHGPADQIIADRLCYMLSAPKRGDLVVFHPPAMAVAKNPADPEIFFFQRVVGLPSEKIEMREGHVLANGRQLGESDGIPEIHYMTLPAGPLMANWRVYEVPQNAYFMLGDNSPNSYDSRYWGYLPKSNIYARVSRIYYPFSRVSVPR